MFSLQTYSFIQDRKRQSVSESISQHISQWSGWVQEWPGGAKHLQDACLQISFWHPELQPLLQVYLSRWWVHKFLFTCPLYGLKSTTLDILTYTARPKGGALIFCFCFDDLMHNFRKVIQCQKTNFHPNLHIFWANILFWWC